MQVLEGYTPGDRAFFGSVPDDDVPGRAAMIGQMQRLAQLGCDYLGEALRHCRARGITPGITIRMNDMHDVPWPDSHLFNRFYRDHPQYWLHNPSATCGWSATGLDYRYPEVRAHFLTLMRELVADYDFEVLELDFLRFTSYFPREDFAAHCAIMTDFLREVRALLATAPRPIALIPRVATTPAGAYEAGFDVATWAREGLIDGLTCGAMLNSSWQMPVDAYRALVGPEIALYACTDMYADRREFLPTRALGLDERLLRGFAAAYLAAGTDGVALFNFFCAREDGWGKPTDPYFHMLKEMRALPALRGKPKTVVLTAGINAVEVDGPLQVPVPVPALNSREFYLWLAAEPDGTPVEIAVTLEAADTPTAETYWLSLNDTPLGPARAIQPEPTAETPMHIAIFAAPSAALRDGRNTLIFRNEGGKVLVQGVDVRCG